MDTETIPLGRTRRWREDGEARFATAGTSLGRLLVAVTPQGVCAVALGDDEASVVEALRGIRPTVAAERAPAEGALGAWLEAVSAFVAGRALTLDVPLDVRGTPFQRRVWALLREIPRGSTRTYRDLAEELGGGESARAVGGACAANPAALVVPCHRVLRSDGGLGGYRWGLERKRSMLALEAVALPTRHAPFLQRPASVLSYKFVAE